MIAEAPRRVGLVVVGAINVDLTARVHRAPERGETVGDGILSREAGGKGANQAVAAARLGAEVRLVGATGNDADGREMRRALEQAGVDVSAVQTVPEPTGTALIVVDAHGENAIVVCPGANASIDPEAVRVPAGEAVLAQLEVGDDVLVAAAAQATGLFVLNASPVRRLPESVLRRVDLLIVNETEYRQMPESHDVPLLALTLGADGAVLFERGTEVARAAGVASVVRSTVGAGDAFAAALVIGIARGDSPSVALHRACAVGAAAVADDRSQPALQVLDAYA